ncbi:MAG: serine/threonine protein kinase [Bifidobacteriaceae bacterium]|jgi:predicted Ser/Thr protein kinase|nr:serine/threonine protein kinase [Bifidobacteriaceae bacterium]
MDGRALPAGTELGGYLLGEVLGSGGMGTVYRAVDADGATVALKLLHPALAADPDSRRRLRREVEVLQRVRCPGVARVVDAEVEGAEAFVVTEFVDGQTLSSTVAADGVYEGEELAELAEALAATLSEVHRAGVIHRDLKPGNVMISPNGPVLIDFGIAQSDEATRLTGTGFVIGTPGFVAPELIAGGEPTQASDDWGLAAALAFAATGRMPFGEGRFDVVFGRVASGRADVAGLRPDVADALLAAMRPNPADRLTASSLAAALRHAADAVPHHPGEPATSRLGWAARADAARYHGRSATAPTELDAGWPDTGPPAAVRLNSGGLDGPAGSGGPTSYYGPGDYDEFDPDSPWADPLPPPRRRILAVALWAGLCATATFQPVVAGGIVGGILLVGRAYGIGLDSLRRWRAKRGARGADGLRLVVASPAYVVRAAVGLAPAVAVGAILGALVWVTLRYGVKADFPPDLALGVGIMVGTGAVWAVPTSERTRRGTLELLGRVAGPLWLRLVVGTVAAAWAAAITASWLVGGAAWPLVWPG